MNDEDYTDTILRDLKIALRPEHLRKVKAAADRKSPARKAVLVRMHDVALPCVSNAPIYGVRFLRPSEQKTFLSLVLGGHFRIYKVSGSLPGEHSKSMVGAHEPYHYKVRATCVVESENA